MENARDELKKKGNAAQEWGLGLFPISDLESPSKAFSSAASPLPNFQIWKYYEKERRIDILRATNILYLTVV